MFNINKVYTKTGDAGETGLGRGGRIGKDHSRIESYGTIDELNSIIGLVRHFNSKKEQSVKRDKFDLILANIQQRLFDVGAELATKPDFKKEDSLTLKESNTLWLENVIDEMNEDLEPLTSFILPGGGIVNSFLHQARTVCRRAEREIVRLNREEEIGPHVLPYVNRLSDALFVFGRWVGAAMGEDETLWQPGMNDPDDWKWND